MNFQGMFPSGSSSTPTKSAASHLLQKVQSGARKRRESSVVDDVDSRKSTDSRREENIDDFEKIFMDNLIGQHENQLLFNDVLTFQKDKLEEKMNLEIEASKLEVEKRKIELEIALKQKQLIDDRLNAQATKE